MAVANGLAEGMGQIDQAQSFGQTQIWGLNLLKCTPTFRIFHYFVIFREAVAGIAFISRDATKITWLVGSFR